MEPPEGRNIWINLLLVISHQSFPVLAYMFKLATSKQLPLQELHLHLKILHMTCPSSAQLWMSYGEWQPRLVQVVLLILQLDLSMMGDIETYYHASACTMGCSPMVFQIVNSRLAGSILGDIHIYVLY